MAEDSEFSKNLLEMSDAEFDKLKERRKKLKEKKDKEILAAIVRPAKQRFADAVMELYSVDAASLPKELILRYTDKAGRFSPHRFLKVPRGS